MSKLNSLILSSGLIIAAATAHADDAVNFMIDWLPAGDKAVVYYGVQSGIFEDAGLDVSILVGKGSSDVVTKLATGTADVGSGGLSALLQAVATDNVPVKAVLSFYSIQPDAIFTTEGSGIESIADLVGKDVGTATFSSSNVVWPLLLEANGLAPDAIVPTKIDPGALAPMLATGQMDATINWSTVSPAFDNVLAETGETLKVLPWSEFGYTGYGLSIFASDTMIDERPEVLSRFVTAYMEATEAAIADPAGAAAALKQMVPEVDEAQAEEQWTVSIPLIENSISDENGKGRFEPELLATTWDWVARSQGMDPASMDPSSAVAVVE
ncbi:MULTISPECIES: ABC transporter substrate-binding protein [Pacificibacter]|uniref:ABC transporter substrate-binding protein n=1 Tax=Pacificibacter TaxID=1042323 RepID=UPI001C0992DF|nr:MULTISPECIES: ABC transporter substrate-binding protein [Pacificibacter]MBU2935153.1 ABC transporter substrate-binding protein [Pacificibacter marinus]MDO6615944.1 ABC transporter substrate-binding protein [Pacificibacter sp. 1_MG-2023]